MSLITTTAKYEPSSSWAVAVDDWLATLTVRPNTLRNYAGCMRSIARLANIRKLQDMTPSRLAPLMVQVWSASRCRSVATILHQFWDYTELPLPRDWRRFRRSLANGQPARPARIVTESDLQAVLGHSGNQLSLLIRLLWETGIRLSEGLNLRVCDVGVADGTIHIRSHDGPIPYRLKSCAADRIIPVTIAAELVDAACGDYVLISPRRARYLQHRPNSMVTPDRAWTPVYRLWRRAIVRSGVTPFTPHDLRHTRLTTWALAEPPMPAAVLQYLAGHSHITTTLQIYTHVQPELAVRRAREILRGVHNAQ